MSIQWKAIYEDGKEFLQYNEDGSENKYKDIDRKKLSRFVLLKENIPLVVIYLDKNKRLICRKRVAQKMNGIQQEVWLAGYQEKIRDKNVQMICFLFEDGHSEILDGFRENHPWFYSINFLPEEKL